MNAYIVTVGPEIRLVVVADSVSDADVKMSELGYMFYDIEDILKVVI